MAQVFHYRGKCIGCYACVQLAPARWRMSKKDGKSVLLGGKEKKGVWTANIDPDEFEMNQSIAELCPARVIKIRK